MDQHHARSARAPGIKTERSCSELRNQQLTSQIGSFSLNQISLIAKEVSLLDGETKELLIVSIG
jgi:hypothetical protein